MWKNFEDLEESICLPELMQILESSRKSSYEQKRFTAALKGVDLDKHTKVEDYDPVEAMKKKVAAQQRNTTVEAMEFEEIGIAVMEFEE